MTDVRKVASHSYGEDYAVVVDGREYVVDFEGGVPCGIQLQGEIVWEAHVREHKKIPAQLARQIIEAACRFRETEPSGTNR